MSVRIRKLSKIDTRGVALVTRGANKKRFALTKSDEDHMADVSELLVKIIKVGAMPTNDKALLDMATREGLDAQAIETFKAVLKLASTYADNQGFVNMLTQHMPLMLGYGEGTKEKAAEQTEAKPAEEYPAKPAEEENEMAEEKKKPADETVVEVEEKAEEVAKAALKVSELEAVLKSQSDVIKTMQDRIVKDADERALAAWIAKAEKDLNFVPGKTVAELAVMLHGIEKAMGVEAATAQFDLLKSTSDVIAKSDLLRATGGTSRGGGSGAKSAYEQLQEKADAILEKSDLLKSSDSPDMVRAKAMRKALEIYPAIYAAYLHEHPAQTKAAS